MGCVFVHKKIRAYRSISVAKGIVRLLQVGVCDLGVLRYTHSKECVYALMDKLVKSSLSKGEVLPVRIRVRVPNWKRGRVVYGSSLEN